MQIVLSILQFFSLLLIVLLVLVLLAVLIVLFHPVRYLVDIHWLDEQWASFKARWFFRLIRAKVSYSDNLVYVSIYDRDLDKYYTMSIDTIDGSREENKRMIIRNIVELLLTII